MFSLSEEEYMKVHSFTRAKQMWDILTLMYKGYTEVKMSKVNLLASISMFTCWFGLDLIENKIQTN